MRKKRSYKEFIEVLLKVHPKLTLLKLHNNEKDFVIVKDELGISYKCHPGNLLSGKVPNIESAVDKTFAFNKQIQSIFPTLIILKYISGRNNVLLKDELDIIYSVSPSSLLNGSYPSILTAINKEEAFIKMANKVHNKSYLYPNLKYNGTKEKISIKCLIHGEFYQTPDRHLAGCGCKKCGFLYKESVGWSKTDWVNFIKGNENRIAKLYIIELWGNEEFFVKIGITSTSLDKRFASKLPYKYKILTIMEDEPDKIFDKEKELRRRFKKYRYMPKMNFGGMYECYKFQNETLDIDKIKELI